MTAEELSGQIGYFFQQEPALEGSVVKAIVDDESIIVTGLVPDQGARHQALKIAKQYAGKRKVIDKITVQK